MSSRPLRVAAVFIQRERCTSTIPTFIGTPEVPWPSRRTECPYTSGPLHAARVWKHPLWGEQTCPVGGPAVACAGGMARPSMGDSALYPQCQPRHGVLAEVKRTLRTALIT